MNKKKWSLTAMILIVIGFAGMAYQGFHFGDDYVHHEQKWTLDSLRSLDVESSYHVDVDIIQSQDGTNYIEISGNMAEDTMKRLKETSITGPDVKLDLTEKLKITFFSINFQSTKQHMTVALADPEAMLEQIRFDLRSNNGSFSNMKAKDIELNTSSGHLTASSVTGEHLKIKASSGNIKATNVQAADTEISISSGNMNLEHIQGNVTAKGTSGNITIDGMDGSLQAKISSGNMKINALTGPAILEGTSGNITLTGQRSDSLDISISSGNVKISTDPEFKGIYDLKTSSGDIKSPDSPLITTDLIKIRTTSGNIRIQ